MALKKVSKKNSLSEVLDQEHAGQKVVIEGTLEYGSLLKKRVPKITGPKDDGNPRYTIQIVDPKIIKGEDTELAEAIQSPDVNNSFFETKDGKKKYKIESRSKFPINIYTDETGSDSLPAPELLANELAPGQTVKIIVSTYWNKGREIISLSLDGVVIKSPENIEYFNSGKDMTDILGKSDGSLAKYKREAPAQTDDDMPEPTEDETQKTEDGIADLFDQEDND